MGIQRQNMAGRRYGRLTVTVAYRLLRRTPQWFCACDCGEWGWIGAGNLKSGTTKSCGCLRRETTRRLSVTHGLTPVGNHHPLYASWCQMIARCENPRNPKYRDYGDRGITVCERWRRSFPEFLADMGSKPSPVHSLDRINNDGNYEPGNVRWATPVEQRHNRRPSTSRR